MRYCILKELSVKQRRKLKMWVEIFQDSGNKPPEIVQGVKIRVVPLIQSCKFTLSGLK
jgi:hypothetical protein